MSPKTLKSISILQHPTLRLTGRGCLRSELKRLSAPALSSRNCRPLQLPHCALLIRAVDAVNGWVVFPRGKADGHPPQVQLHDMMQRRADALGLVVVVLVVECVTHIVPTLLVLLNHCSLDWAKASPDAFVVLLGLDGPEVNSQVDV
jgi:hypothetical protein